MECIILAGGLGTRLRSEVSEWPKSMAPILGKPFVSYLLQLIHKAGATHIIFSVGYLSHTIQNYFGDTYEGIKISYANELEPLGTGGAIKNALKFSESNQVCILNGDTLFDIDFNQLTTIHQDSQAAITLALKSMNDASRYGTVTLSSEGRILSFNEKQMGASGVINGGIYLINKALCEAFLTQEKFSFEKDFLEKNTDRLHMQSFISESFFIDIGIPEDYQKAQQTFHQFNTWHVQPNWTLFLDRDGVVNKKIENGYVTHWDKFEFLPHTFQALALAKKYFKRIVLVTNQQCVGKQIISENELNAIHDFMLKEIQLHGGNIDAIYVAPQLAKENHQDRKPGIGMPLKAQIDFPEIDFQQSIICGDSISDMEMGASLGMKKIFIGAPFCNQADATFKNLSDAIDFFINIAN